MPTKPSGRKRPSRDSSQRTLTLPPLGVLKPASPADKLWSMTTQLSRDVIRAFPKVELHVHVEACITGDRIESLAAEAGVPMLRPVERLFEYSSLVEFLETFEWWCDLLRTPETAEGVAYDAAALLAADGIVYADVLTGPRYWEHVDDRELIRALGAGFERAHRDGLTDCRLVPSICREQSPQWAMELVEWIGAESPTRVVGLGLDGNEALLGRTTPKFEDAYARAGELGLGRTVHAGESSGPEGVHDVLEYLHVDRIDHGVRAIEDPDLTARLADEGNHAEHHPDIERHHRALPRPAESSDRPFHRCRRTGHRQLRRPAGHERQAVGRVRGDGTNSRLESRRPGCGDTTGRRRGLL